MVCRINALCGKEAKGRNSEITYLAVGRASRRGISELLEEGTDYESC